MKVVEPRIFCVAETKLIESGYNLALTHIGADNWSSHGAWSEAEELCEFAGRLCYKSFGTELNKNLTQVREGNSEYLGNVIKQAHGSIFEHVSTSVVMVGVSRILTHEYVRHRVGKGYSQESMRFVRMDDIPMYIPDLTNDFKELERYQGDFKYNGSKGFGAAMQLQYEQSMKTITEKAEEMISFFNTMLDQPGVPFSVKKKITSALRRMAPSGHTTNIMGTGTHRAWRHLIAQRTSRHAEEEIRKVFNMIAEEFYGRYPAIYQDMKRVMVDGYYEYYFEGGKI